MKRVCRPDRHRCGRRVALLVCAWVALGGACRRVARSPEDAFARLQGVVAARDATGLYDVLDQRSRWAFMTVQKSHREAYDIILSNYPEGPERERELRRFQKGAMLGSGRELFADELGARALGDLPDPLPAASRFEAPAAGSPETEVADARAEGASEPWMFAVLPDGRRLPFRKGPDGGWGLATFARDAAERQNRALRDVELVRANAADYERAATRASH